MSSSSVPYLVPIETSRTETKVSNSRFITTISRADSTEDVKGLLRAIREELSDGTHHVYAFRIGYGNSVIEGMSDAGEPQGTAGAPILNVIRGTDIGDILIVVTRYFGGTKLGTGGLVRAYTEAARIALNRVGTEKKIPKQRLRIDAPYRLYDTIKRLIASYDGLIENEVFAASVVLTVSQPIDTLAQFNQHLRDASAGQITAEELDGG
jgi:uncharacterized YigZ family protein